jgi:hypothetical protein
VLCSIVQDGAAAAASIILINVTAGTSVSFTVTPGRSRLPTEQCNWAVEALKINSPDVALARFGAVYFDGAYGNNTLGTTFPAGSGNTIDMYAAGRQIAYGRVAAPYTVVSTYGPNPF